MQAKDVLDFWFRGSEVRKAWFEKNAAFDEEIRSRFLALWEAAREGKLESWTESRDAWLAYVVLCDQFPRNMFRGDPRAFATDARALAAARHGVGLAWHRQLHEAAQMFVYLPFEHSEAMADQERALELFTGHPNHEWAVKHWEIIKRFGRFPHRNAVLGRASTPEEIEFLKQPGSGF